MLDVSEIKHIIVLYALLVVFQYLLEPHVRTINNTYLEDWNNMVQFFFREMLSVCDPSLVLQLGDHIFG